VSTASSSVTACWHRIEVSFDAVLARVLLCPRSTTSGFEGGVRGPRVLAGVDRGWWDEPGFVVDPDADFPLPDEPGFPVHQPMM
jgi:hypothetical protein